MKRFTQLYTALDETTRTNEKVSALATYFREADPADAAWALFFLCGKKLPRAITSTALQSLAAEESGLPHWLFEECYHSVGDLAETVSLVLPEPVSSTTLPLHELISDRLLPMREAGDTTRRDLLLRTWRELNRMERLVWNKLITGGFRVGVAQTLVVRAMASVAGVEQAVMAHRLLGKWEPTADDFRRLMSESDTGAGEVARPYPFFLASPLEGEPESLGDIADWQVEWKWDGIRAQVIRRSGEVILWSRGDEIVTASFPEIAEAVASFPDGTVLDGEILAWQEEAPQPFVQLQRRLGRKNVSARMRSSFPVVLIAYDLLEKDGRDLRDTPLTERRQMLEQLIEEIARKPVARSKSDKWETPDLFEFVNPTRLQLPVRLSEALRPASWDELRSLQQESRARHVEGLMLKRRMSPYAVGRQRGDWWKWKIDPLVIDAVLMNAQLGHGRRASLYTDYTFGLWDNGTLVPVAKAYSGLSDDEIRQVDTFVRANTIDKFGPVRAVKPELVFELAFEAVQASTRHKSGIAVRFPRMNRWRHDKKPTEADTLDNLRALLPRSAAARSLRSPES